MNNKFGYVIILLYLHSTTQTVTATNLFSIIQNGSKVILVATTDSDTATFASRNADTLRCAFSLINNMGEIEIYPGTYPVNSIEIPAKVRLNFKRGAVFTFTNNQLVGSFPLVKIL